MTDILSNDLRGQYHKAFQTILGIVEAFPESRWLEPHGDEYYIPCRIAYHIAVVIHVYIAGGFKDKDFHSKLPYGRWLDAKAADLPDQKAFLSYLNGALGRAGRELSVLTDEDLVSAIEPERAWAGASKMGIHLFIMRELSDHTGELNKMLIEDGGQDIWIFK